MNVIWRLVGAVSRPAVLHTGPWSRPLAVNTPSSFVTHFSSSSVVEAIDAAPQAEEKDELYRTVELEVKGHDAAVLKSYEWFVTTAAQELDINVGKCWALRKPNFNRMTLLKSVHIYKKHRVQYEIRTHYRFMQFHQLTGSTADTFLEYIQRNLPEGVGLKVTRVQVQPLPDHLTPPSPSADSPSS